MTVSIASSFLKSGKGALQFHRLIVRYRSLQCRNVCRVHSLCYRTGFVQQTLRLSPAVVGMGYLRTGIAQARLPCSCSGVRWFSDNERDENDNRGNDGFKAFVFHVPNPLKWFKGRWYTYQIQFLLDPLFSLGDFQIGAKQVWLLFCCHQCS